MSSAMNRPEVVVAGSSNTDMVVASPRLPRWGETVLGGDFYQAAGGKGANQAVAAARAGAGVAFLGAMGNDAQGAAALDNLSREGIDITHVVTMAGQSSGVALILVDDEGRNLISVAPGANAALTPEMMEQAKETIQGAKVLLLQLEIPVSAVEKAAAMAADKGVTVIFNPAPAPCEPLPRAFLETVDILIANEEETAQLAAQLGCNETDTDHGAQAILKQGLDRLVVTLGDKGGRVYGKEAPSRRWDAEKVKAVDTVGAGDCFCGWLAAELARGATFSDAISLAARASALSVTRRGAQPSLPYREELNKNEA